MRKNLYATLLFMIYGVIMQLCNCFFEGDMLKLDEKIKEAKRTMASAKIEAPIMERRFSVKDTKECSIAQRAECDYQMVTPRYFS